MANKNTKKTNKNARFKAKKVATYDNRLLIIIAAALAAIVAIIVTAVSINSYLNSFVCKVNGSRIMDYEYEMFLGTTKEEMEDEAREALKEDEKFDSKKFWTDEKLTEAKDKALKDAIEWKSQFMVAKDAGFALKGKAKAEYETTVQNNLYTMWYMNYLSYYKDFGSFVSAYLGNISYDDYIKFACQDKAIADYRANLQKAYDQKTDAFRADVTAKYGEDGGNYRRVQMLTFEVSKNAITEVKEPTAPTKPTTEENETAKEWIDYKAALAKYEKDKKSYDEYLEKKAKQDAENAKIKERLEAMVASLNSTGKFSGDGFVELPKKDADGKDTKEKEIKKYTDATLGEIAKAESSIFSNEGKYEFTKETTADKLIIDDYANSLTFKDDTRKEIVTSMEEEQFATTTKIEGDVTGTTYILIEDDSYFYITKCTGILDLVTSGEGKSTDDSTCVWDVVAADVLADYSLRDLNKTVADNSEKLKPTAAKTNVIETVAKKVFG